MRCPKCGYISFDNLQNCKKCKKDVMQTSSELNGTIYNAASPLFLQYAFEEDTGDVAVMEPPEVEEIPVEIPIDEEPEEIALDMDEEPSSTEAESMLDEVEDEDVIMDLDDLEELAPRDEFTLDIDSDEAEEEPVEAAAAPDIDFSDLDISDLAPPGEEQPVPAETAEELEPVAALSETSPLPPPPQDAPAKEQSDSFGLEDLQLDDLDLDSPAKPVTGSAANQKVAPSVKTGTALDTFEIDLGDLFAEKKE